MRIEGVAMETEDTSLEPIDDAIAETPDDGMPELPVVCTEHTSSNLHGYLFLLVFGLVMIVSCIFNLVSSEPGPGRMMAALLMLGGVVLAALAAFMLLVWKNRQIEVGEEGIVITDFTGKSASYTWDDVRITDGRTTSTGDIVFRTRDKREEPFAPTCGGFRAMCEALIAMGRLRRIDEAALARKRKMKGLFDVVMAGRKREKPDESLYLPDDTEQR